MTRKVPLAMQGLTAEKLRTAGLDDNQARDLAKAISDMADGIGKAVDAFLETFERVTGEAPPPGGPAEALMRFAIVAAQADGLSPRETYELLRQTLFNETERPS